MARLYSNENFPLPVVEALRRLGHDMLTIQETGQANREVMAAQVIERRFVEAIPTRERRQLGPEREACVLPGADPDVEVLTLGEDPPVAPGQAAV